MHRPRWNLHCKFSRDRWREWVWSPENSKFLSHLHASERRQHAPMIFKVDMKEHVAGLPWSDKFHPDRWGGGYGSNQNIPQPDSMRWFSRRRSPSLPGGTQWYRLLLRAAYGLATAHALLCIVNGDDSAVFRFFVPGDLDLWPWPSNSGEIFVQRA